MRIKLLQSLIGKRAQDDTAKTAALPRLATTTKPQVLDRVEFHFCAVCGTAVPSMANSCSICKGGSLSRSSNT